MKKKYLFVFGLSILVIPFLASALKMQMDPITPCITSIPCFIKSLLDIVFKLGIAAATFFLIWAGFLFLKAQGDPEGLTTAKRAFTWAVIGTAVIFGSWMLSTVIKVTIWQRIGSNVPLESFDICSCATTTVTPTPVPTTCVSLGKQCVSANTCQSGTTVASSDCSSPNACCTSSTQTPANVALSCPTKMLQENTTPPFVSLNLENNPFAEILPETNNCSFGNSMDTLVDWAKELPNENSYVVMIGAHINGKVVDVTLDVNEGTNAGTVLADPNDVQQLLTKYNPSEIYIVHTHPLESVGAGSQASPSDIDFTSAINYGVFDPRVKFAVADSTGVWGYNPPMFTEWANQQSKLQNNVNLPGRPTALDTGDTCGEWSILQNALAGQYGPESKTWAEKIMADSGDYLTAHKLQTEAVSGVDALTGRMLTVAERNTKTNQAVFLQRQLGIPMTYYSQIQLQSCP